MRIYCPKCKTGYEIDGDLIPEEGKKLRCSYCQTVFTATKADLREEPNFPELKKQAKPDESETAEVTDGATDTTPEKPVDDEVMKGIFQRLSTQTENLFEAEKKVPLGKKIISKVKRSLGLKHKVNRYLSLAAIVAFLGLILYNYRFDIVRTLPFMNNIYAAVGVRAKIPGEGLAFQNIVWKDFEDDYVRQLEIKGFIVNNSGREVAVPILRVDMLDKDTKSLQVLDQKPSVKTLQPGGRVAVSMIVKKPSPLTKYVYMTFIDKY